MAIPDCKCPRIVYCGHCLKQNRLTQVSSASACRWHGELKEEDFVVAFPEGHHELLHHPAQPESKRAVAQGEQE